MARVRVLILRAAGINCDAEAAFAWQRAGAATEAVHIRRLAEQPDLLNQFQALTIPGGFSYGDDIAAGRVLAAQLERHLADALREFVARDGLILGICNGFQVLVKAGLLPSPQTGGARTCTITYNEPPGFQDRWLTMRGVAEHCVFIARGAVYEMPMAHGEGRVVFADAAAEARALAAGHAALVYQGVNPNGSAADIAGMCDESGRVFGLMPHPERFIEWTQHPCWTSQPERPEGDGLAVFRRGVAYFE